MNLSACELCGAVFESGRLGRPRLYCSDECGRAMAGLAAIERVLEARPQALPNIAEILESCSVDMTQLTDAGTRRVRAALFTMASRGRRLAPGTSGRYARSKA